MACLRHTRWFVFDSNESFLLAVRIQNKLYNKNRKIETQLENNSIEHIFQVAVAMPFSVVIFMLDR